MRLLSYILDLILEAMSPEACAPWLAFLPDLTTIPGRVPFSLQRLPILQLASCRTAPISVLAARFRLGPYANGPP